MTLCEHQYTALLCNGMNPYYLLYFEFIAHNNFHPNYDSTFWLIEQNKAPLKLSVTVVQF